MRVAIVLATIIAAIAFVFGLIGSLFATGASFAERIMLAAMPAAMAFAAALALFARDHWRYASVVRAVRQVLLARDDVTDAEFSSYFPDSDSVLLGQIRQAVSVFFDVPAAKIHPTDDLRRDLRCDKLEPSLHSFVVYHVLNARSIAPQSFVFHTIALNGFGDLVKEIQRVLDGFDCGKEHDSCRKIDGQS